MYVCNGDDVVDREGGRGVAKTVDIPELGGFGIDDPRPEATALFSLPITTQIVIALVLP